MKLNVGVSENTYVELDGKKSDIESLSLVINGVEIEDDSFKIERNKLIISEGAAPAEQDFAMKTEVKTISEENAQFSGSH